MCSCSLHSTSNSKDRETYELTRSGVINLSFSSYMAGCVYALVDIGKKGKAQDICKDKANNHVEEVIRPIVFGD